MRSTPILVRLWLALFLAVLTLSSAYSSDAGISWTDLRGRLGEAKKFVAQLEKTSDQKSANRLLEDLKLSKETRLILLSQVLVLQSYMGQLDSYTSILPLLKNASPAVRASAYFTAAFALKNTGLSLRETSQLERAYFEALGKETQPPLQELAKGYVNYFEVGKGSNPRDVDWSQVGQFQFQILMQDSCTYCLQLLANLKTDGYGNPSEVFLDYPGNPQLPVKFLDIEKLDPKFSKIKDFGTPTLVITRGKDILVHSTLHYGLNYLGIKKLVSDSLRGIAPKSPPARDLVLAKALEARPRVDKRVLLTSSGEDAWSTPIANADTLVEIQGLLADYERRSDFSLITLFGAGNDRTEADTYETLGNLIPRFIKDDRVKREGSFTPLNVKQVFETSRNQGVQNLLMIVFGHGQRKGVPTWQSGLMTPNDFTAVDSAYPEGLSVLLSGTCYGGAFAKKLSCGFFAARPDMQSSGCYENPNNRTGNYILNFLSTLPKGKNNRAADWNGDGTVTLEEAHWYSVLNASPMDRPYSTLDALADEYFDKKGIQLPRILNNSDIKGMLDAASEGEYKVLEKLIEPGVEKIDPYPKVLQIVRRIRYKQLVQESRDVNYDRFLKAKKCEETPIQEFVY